MSLLALPHTDKGRKILRGLAAILVVLAAMLFSWTGVHSLLYAPNSEIAIPSQVIPVASATSSQPVRLIIPALGVDAKVQNVGITQNNAMGTPNNFTDVGWYKYGPVPGAPGTAVIDGHVDNGLSLAGVFKHLIDIKVGDSIIVVARNGAETHFVVVKIDIYPYQNTPSAAIFDATAGPTQLNLITCEGAWVPAGRTYDHRLVVSAILASK